ncbi:hypothetical protein [Planktothrix phage Pag-Yong1]|nr:hypothetical protein [Planktothrix phage Pag-Yong1]WEV89233.1 hypothetical protein [Synechococcus phage MinM2]
MTTSRSEAPGKPKSPGVRFSIYISTDTLRRLQRMASRARVTRSKMVARLIDEAFARQKP